MARKRLSNLNSAESKKAPQPQVESAPLPDSEQAAPESPATNPQPTQKHDPNASSAEPLEIEVPYVEVKAVEEKEGEAKPIEPQDKVSVDRPPSEAPTAHPDLEATIAELHTTLEATRESAKQREAELLDQIAHLQAELQAQQTSTEQLQTELKQMNRVKTELEKAEQQSRQFKTELEKVKKQSGQLETELEDARQQATQLKTELEDTRQQSSQFKTELEDAKKMILQLSQVNNQPTQSRPSASKARTVAPQRQPIAQNPMQPLPAQPQSTDRQSSPLVLQRQSYPVRQPSYPLAQQKISPEEKPAQRIDGQENSNLSDADMGWVD